MSKETSNVSEDLRINKTWEVVRSFLKRSPHIFAFNQIESYNAFIKEIPNILASFNGQTIETKGGQKYTINFGKYSLTTPEEEVKSFSVEKRKTVIRKLYPNECIQRNIQYEAKLYVDITVTPGSEYKNFLLMTMPVMVGSDLCNLSKIHLDEEKMSSLGEDIFDSLGYFVCVPTKKDNGIRTGNPLQKRHIVFQERMTFNRFFYSTFGQKKVDRTKYPFTSNIELRCSSEISSVNIVNMGMKEDGRIRLDLPWLKDYTYPILVILYALGYDVDFFLKSMTTFDDREIIEKCINDAYGVYSQEDAIQYMMTPWKFNKEEKAQKEPNQKEKENKRKYIEYTLRETFLCHLNHKDLKTNYRRKAYYIIHMAKKKMEHSRGAIRDTIKDHFAYKRVLTSGNICSQHFYNTLKKLFGKMKKAAKQNEEKSIDIISFFDSDYVSRSWKNAFISNFWDITLQNKKGICQLVDGRNRMEIISSLNKMYLGIGGEDGKDVKVVEPRDFHMSQSMKIDPYDTPEGGKVGLLKTTAISTHITISKDPRRLYKILFSLENNKIRPFDEITDEERPDRMTKIMCDGVWVGCCKEEDSESILTEIRGLRRNLSIDYDVTIYREDDCICIFSDHGRMIRPVFIVEDGKIKLTEKDLKDLKKGKISFYHLLEKGVVEFIGDLEEDSPETYVAVNVDQITKEHSHCEIHETFMAGFSTNDSPFFNRNPAARGCYEDSMKKQAAGLPSANYRRTYDNGAIILNYPQKPLACTRYTKELGLDQTPAEQCYMTLVYAGKYNEEDSVELNKAPIDRGLGVITITKVYCTEYQDEGFLGFSDEGTEGPTKETVDLSKNNPELLDEDGIVKVGSKVKNGDILIALFQINKEYEVYQAQCEEKRKKGLQIEEKPYLRKYINKSIVYDSDVHGVVDSCQITESPYGGKFIRVCVLQTRRPEVGDKFCLTEDHEILTTKGWMSIKDVQEYDVVLTIDKQSELNYRPVQRKYKFSVKKDEPLYSVQTDQVDLITTLNHKMYVKDEYEKNYKLMEAQKVHDLLSMQAEVYKNPSIQYKSHVDYNNHGYNSSSLGEDIPRLAEAFAYYVSGNGSFYGDTDFVKKMGQMYMNKPLNIPTNLFNSTKEHKKFFFKKLGFLLRDNYPMEKKPTTFRLKTTNKTLKDNLQIMALHAGYSSIIHDDFIEINLKPTPVVVYHKDQKIIHSEKDQFVYCVEVPDHTFFVRRNGKAVWTGNSAKHGQKGTVGMIHNQEDMPFNAEGISPDIMINAAAFPSRMTAAMFVEILSGKAVASTSILHSLHMGELTDHLRRDSRGIMTRGKLLLEDGRVDATAFIEEAKIKEFQDELRRKGRGSTGDELFYDGCTGEPLRCFPFFGPVAYHRLHHFSREKNHARATGRNTPLFRQPVEGRADGGGMRLGVQERDALIAMCNPAVLKDGYFHRSDAFSIKVCSSCGVMVDGDNCKLCY